LFSLEKLLRLPRRRAGDLTAAPQWAPGGGRWCRPGTGRRWLAELAVGRSRMAPWLREKERERVDSKIGNWIGFT